MRLKPVALQAAAPSFHDGKRKVASTKKLEKYVSSDEYARSDFHICFFQLLEESNYLRRSARSKQSDRDRKSDTLSEVSVWNYHVYASAF